MFFVRMPLLLGFLQHHVYCSRDDTPMMPFVTLCSRNTVSALSLFSATSFDTEIKRKDEEVKLRRAKSFVRKTPPVELQWKDLNYTIQVPNKVCAHT